MASTTYDILQLAGFEQGTIGQTYDSQSDTRVRTIGYIAMNDKPLSALLSATASTAKQVQVAFRGYSGTTPESLVCNIYWYDSPHDFDLSSYSNINYFRIVLCYSDNSNITPSEINACQAVVKEPALWEVEDGKLTHDDLPAPIESPFAPPYPPFWWYVDNGRLVNSNLPAPVLRGAFANCKSLDTAHIPESVKSIGQYAFRNTALESVKIASDCTYSATSFPEDCEIEYYTDPDESEGDNNE